ncbi:hypothetical protein HK096_007403, partial [Nowakowskiella sp. JEL0078]
LSGTSMSTPYATGVIALLLQIYGKKITSQISNEINSTFAHAILQSTAESITSDKNIHPSSTGSGLIRPISALLTPMILIPSMINLSKLKERRTVRVNFTGVTFQRSENNTPLNFTIRHEPSYSLDFNQTGVKLPYISSTFPLKSAWLNKPVKVSFSEVNFQINETNFSIDIIFEPPTELSSPVLFGGYIIATASSGVVLRSTYTGILGNFIPIFLSTTNGSFPFIKYRNAEYYGVLEQSKNDEIPSSIIPLNISFLNNQTVDFVYSVQRPLQSVQFLLLSSLIPLTNSDLKIWNVVGQISRSGRIDRNDSNKPNQAFSWNGIYTMANENTSKIFVTVEQNGSIGWENLQNLSKTSGFKVDSNINVVIGSYYRVLGRFESEIFGDSVEEYVIQIVVGTENKAKIAAVKLCLPEVIKRLNFPNVKVSLESGLVDETIWNVTGISVPSGVRDQPMSDEETLQGAKNRANSVLAKLPSADFGIGIEGGVQKIGDVWMESGWVVVVDKYGKTGYGSSGRFQLSGTIIDRLTKGEELATVIDDLCGQTDVRSGLGAMGIVTNGILARDLAYSH